MRSKVFEQARSFEQRLRLLAAAVGERDPADAGLGKTLERGQRVVVGADNFEAGKHLRCHCLVELELRECRSQRRFGDLSKRAELADRRQRQRRVQEPLEPRFERRCRRSDLDQLAPHWLQVEQRAKRVEDRDLGHRLSDYLRRATMTP